MVILLFRYRNGITLEGETIESGQRTVHMYYSDMEDSWTLADSEDSNVFVDLFSIDDVQETARQHFDAGMD